mmetsp:Transcript_114346/g.319531  ORF Transcript_114346/g.319531 Transcript_114346/m.319531 type:complete len:229 (+) Transcript_114346:54-740(+)
MFCSITQEPSRAALLSKLIATCSCPCPMEMLLKRPFASVMFNVFAKASTVGVGSVPGKSTKKMGVMCDDSSYVCAMSNGGCSMNSPPKLSVTNWVNAAPILSGRSTRSKKRRWNMEMSRQPRGKSATSARSSANQRFQPKESCSKFCVSAPVLDLKTATCSKLLSCDHCPSDNHARVLSGMGGALGSGGARIRSSSSSGCTAPERTSTRKASMEATVSLSLSSSPRRM